MSLRRQHWFALFIMPLALAGSLILWQAYGIGSDAPSTTAKRTFLPGMTAKELLSAYDRAEELPQRWRNKITGWKVEPVWFADGKKFWYRNDLLDGQREFILVNVEKGERKKAFDHDKLAKGLSQASKREFQATRLPLSRLQFGDDGLVEFLVGTTFWQCNLQTYECKQKKFEDVNDPIPQTENDTAYSDTSTVEPNVDAPQVGGRGRGGPGRFRTGRSPDKQWNAFTKDNNLFLSEENGETIQLTKNGHDKDSYGFVRWSPDSKHFVFYRIIPGDNKEVHLIETSPKDQWRAKLQTRVYPLPGDKFASYQMWIGDVKTKTVKKVDFERIDFRGPPRLNWKKDNQRFLFERTDRGHQRYRIVEVSCADAKTRTILDEKAKTFIDHYSAHFFRYFPDSDEIIYMSEMDGWKHLYLIDAKAGKIKNQITKGEWVVRGVDEIDEKNRQIWFRACGRNKDQDPYLIHYYRINFDGTGLTALTEGNGNHTIRYSPDRKYLIDTYSRLDQAPITELRKVSDGKLVCVLEKADVTALEKENWHYPEVFHAKGRDGKTDIWGVVYRPSNLDPNRQYPVIEYIYAGPHDSHVPKSFRSFSGLQSLAELGFIVVQIDGMGTANRSRAFHDVCWKNIADAGFPDRKLWIQTLAQKYNYMDISRVGIFGTSAGGQNALGALLFHGDFYKVAVAACGCHDNRLDKPSWNEQWMGLLGPHYEKQSNVVNAHKLTGKLLLILGELDTNVPPESTMRVVDALIRANKDFDLLVMPGVGHSSGGRYGEMRRRDFFVRHLHGLESPDRNKVRN